MSQQNKIYVEMNLSDPSWKYVEEADRCRKTLGKPSYKGGQLRSYYDLTTTQMRNLWGRMTTIYNQFLMSDTEQSEDNNKLPGRIMQQLQAFKVRLIYECGRTEDVKKFCEKSGILKGLDQIKENKEYFIRYVRYMEALVAYHYFYTDQKNK